MKTYFIAMILCCSYWSLAQDWTPFTIGETYNYRDNNPSHIYPRIDVVSDGCNGPYPNAPFSFSGIDVSTTLNNELQIWIDTSVIQGGDSIYYFNGKVLPCTTCSSPAILVDEPLQCGLFNEFYRKDSLGVYQFIYEGDIFTLDMNLLVGDSVLCNSSVYLYSKLSSCTLDTLWYNNGTSYVIDSVKHFDFVVTGGALYCQLRLTKHHGIYSFIDHANSRAIIQVGIESLNLGLTQLSVEEIYGFADYQVGDTYYRQYYNFWNQEVGHVFRKDKVLNIQQPVVDSIIITFDRSMWGISANTGFGPTNVTLIRDTFDLVIDSAWYSNQQNYTSLFYGWTTQKVLRDNEMDLSYYSGRGLTNLGIYVKNFLIEGNRQYVGFSYNFGLDSLWPWGNHIDDPAFEVVSGTSVYHQFDNMPDSHYALYGEGLGLVYEYSGFFEGWGCSSLIGYIKGQDTVGVIPPDTIFTAIAELYDAPKLDVEVYPNPSSGRVEIKLSDILTMPDLEVSILNLQGIEVYKNQFITKKHFTLDLANLSNGVYFLCLYDGDGNIAALEKLVVAQ